MQVNIVGGNRSVGELAETLTQAAILGPDAVEEFARGLSLFNEWSRMGELVTAMWLFGQVMARIIPQDTTQTEE